MPSAMTELFSPSESRPSDWKSKIDYNLNSREEDEFEQETEEFFKIVTWNIDEKSSSIMSSRGMSAEDTVDGLFDSVDTQARLQHQTSATFDKKSEDEQEEITKYIAEKLNEISNEVMRTHGSNRTLPKVEDLLNVSSYEGFSSLIGAAFDSGDPNSAQLALYYKMTRELLAATVQTNISQNVIQWSKQYFRRTFAPWVARRNGLKSCVESSVIVEDSK